MLLKETNELTTKELINELLSLRESLEHLGWDSRQQHRVDDIESELNRRGITNIQ